MSDPGLGTGCSHTEGTPFNLRDLGSTNILLLVRFEPNAGGNVMKYVRTGDIMGPLGERRSPSCA